MAVSFWYIGHSVALFRFTMPDDPMSLNDVEGRFKWCVDTRDVLNFRACRNSQVAASGGLGHTRLHFAASNRELNRLDGKLADLGDWFEPLDDSDW